MAENQLVSRGFITQTSEVIIPTYTVGGAHLVWRYGFETTVNHTIVNMATLLGPRDPRSTSRAELSANKAKSLFDVPTLVVLGYIGEYIWPNYHKL